jgi:tetratricopeptide (TPR) repeat protein
MSGTIDPLEWFTKTFREYAQDLRDVTDWRFLKNAAIYRRHTGDIDGAIEALVKAIGLMKADPQNSEQMATSLNYLADLYLTKDAIAEAEMVIRDAVELSRPAYPSLLGANLWILAGILLRKGEKREALAAAEESREVYQQEGNLHGVGEADELIRKIRATA